MLASDIAFDQNLLTFIDKSYNLFKKGDNCMQIYMFFSYFPIFSERNPAKQEKPYLSI